jgi:hypothetical protein
MRRPWLCLLLIGCGGDDAAIPDAPSGGPDVAQTCQPISAIGSFYRRQPNPRIISGAHAFTGGGKDTAIADPDLSWNDADQRWHLYYGAPHGAVFSPPGPPILRHASSADLATWTFDDAPVLSASTSGWDRTRIEAPTVVENPDAPADRRFLLLYAGAAGDLANHDVPAFSIGAAFSADGRTFTRVSASDSPHGEAGLVFIGAQAYPGAVAAAVFDPEVAYVGGTYHLWFSSFACSGASCATVSGRGIGYATSTDGVTWTPVAAPVPTLLRASADPTTGGKKPTVIYDPLYCRWEMWMSNDLPADTTAQPVVANNTAGLWHALSTNGTSWSVNFAFPRDVVWSNTAQGEALGMAAGADVAAKSTGRYMLYGAYDDQNVPAGSTLPTSSGTTAGVTVLNLATRDAPP